MNPLRLVALLAGAALVALLLARLPQDVMRTALAFLLVASSLILLLTAAGLFLLPARRLLARLFALPLTLEGPALGLPREDELKTALSPLAIAGVCLAVALLASLLRASTSA